MPYSDLTGRKVGGSGAAVPAGTYNSTRPSTFFNNNLPFSSNGCRGISITVSVTAAPNSTDSLNIELDGYDPVTGIYYVLWSGATQAGSAMQAAISSPGVFINNVYALPGITNTAGAKFNNVLPEQFRVLVVHSAGSNFTYACGYDLIP